MNHTTYLTPGPSALYFTVEQHLRTALREQIPSVSHRSQTFKDIFRHTDAQLRTLLEIPEGYHITFTSSANEVWERLIQNCVNRHSHHFVNGAFSHKFHQFSTRLGREATRTEAAWGAGFNDPQQFVANDTELIAVTLNETSTGVQFPKTDLQKLRAAHPEALLAVDATSGIPVLEVPIQEIDSLYFSVQKAFGLPAGLGVWITNERCLQKARAREAEGQITGTYHRLTELVRRAQEYQTPETPNMLGIYLLGKVCEDMNTKGIAQIRREATYKATLLYHALEQHPLLSPFVAAPEWRSPTVVVADIQSADETAATLIERFREQGIELGSGYGKMKTRQLRFANFPTHSKELIERVTDLLPQLVT